MTATPERAGTSIERAPAPVPHLDNHLLRIVAGGVAARTGRSRAQGDRYKRFLDAIAVAVYTTDPDGRITFYNEAAAAFWGRRPALGELWCGSWRIYRPDGTLLPHDQCPMAVALREGREVRGEEAVAERPDGSRVWFQPYPTPLHDDDGVLIGAVNVLVDVTEQRRAEDALRRTARALETSNAVKDDFLGLVSHELRTPVTTIVGNARLLHDRGDRLDERVRSGMVADMLVDADRLQSIVENLLQLTRLGSGQEPELEPHLIDLVVRRAVAAFRRRRPEREIRVDAARSGIVVEADETWLDLVVSNLLSNADKYSPPGQPIDVAIRAVESGVEVAVLDRGIGLEGSPGEDLFQPFYRSPHAKAAANGVGIGLTVCRRIVECLGGRIGAEARPGGGTAVAFVLPAAAMDPRH